MVLTVRGTFTDETDAVSAVEIVPGGIMDETSTVFTCFMTMGPVIRLAGLPLPDSNNMNHMSKFKHHTRCLLATS